MGLAGSGLPIGELTTFSQRALDILRDPAQFKWYAVTLLVFVFYAYGVEVEKRNWSAVLAGLALWCFDWSAEVLNALVLHFTNYSAVWTTTGSTAFEIFVGLNIEISMMFAVAGVIFVKYLPHDRRLKILGIPNRWVFVFVFALIGVFVESLLHATGYFHWPYVWWNFPVIPLIVCGYAAAFGLAAWVYDMRSLSRQAMVVGILAAIAIVLIVIFGVVLGWV